MNDMIRRLLSAGLLIMITIFGVLLIISLLFLIGFKEWMSSPLFMGCVLAICPLALLTYWLYQKNQEEVS